MEEGRGAGTGEGMEDQGKGDPVLVEWEDTALHRYGEVSGDLKGVGSRKRAQPMMEVEWLKREVRYTELNSTWHMHSARVPQLGI